MMEERGVSVDHSSINRLAIRFLPLIEKMARKHKRLVGGSWRTDKTYIKIKGVWKYLYRAVGRQGKTGDFLLKTKRDMTAAKRFFNKAMAAHGAPDKVVMDKSGANKAVIDEINACRAVLITVRQVKYLDNRLPLITRFLRLLAASRSRRGLGGRFLVDSVDADLFWSGFLLRIGRPVTASYPDSVIRCPIWAPEPAPQNAGTPRSFRNTSRCRL